MIKTITLKYDEKDHKKLEDLKINYKKRKNLSKISWEDFLFLTAVNFK